MDRRSLLMPGIAELIGYAFLSFFIMAVTQYETLISFLAGRDYSSGEFGQVLSEAFARRFDAFLVMIETNGIAASVTLALFWALIGALVYLFVAALQRFFVDTEEELEAEATYVHPRNYSHIYFWFRFSARVIFRTAMLTAIGLYVFWMADVLIPLWIELIEAWLEDPSVFQKAVNAGLAFIGFIFSWHVIAVLSRLLFLRNRVFSTI